MKGQKEVRGTCRETKAGGQGRSEEVVEIWTTRWKRGRERRGHQSRH